MKFGHGTNYWIVEGDHFDISRGAAAAPTMALNDGRTLQFDPAKSAFVIVDMQNYFCSPKLGRPDGALKLVPAIRSAIESCRKLGIQIIWVNWGNRPDTANLPPSLLYMWQRSGRPGLGDPLPDDLGPTLTKDSWSADLTPELKELERADDLWVDKYRTSGFPGTHLDQVLRSAGITTLFHAGVNTDQCVKATIQDGHFLGYDNILLTDCTATTSPDYVLEGAMFNMRGSTFMTVSDSLAAIAAASTAV